MRVALAILLTGLICVATSAAATPVLYEGSAQALMPTAEETGYAQITSQGGSGGRASATYETPGTRPQYLKVALRVFKTEPAALSSFNAACPGCKLKAVGSGSWKFKQRLDLAADGNTLTLVARCRNVRVDTTQRVYGTNPHVVAGGSKRIIERIFQKARNSGMSPCAGTGSTPPTNRHVLLEGVVRGTDGREQGQDSGLQRRRRGLDMWDGGRVSGRHCPLSRTR